MSEVVLRPIDLLTKDSFGLPSKTMAAVEILEGRSSWGVRTYLEVLRKWNRFYEEDPPKTSQEDFLEAFKRVLYDMRDGRFDWRRSPIPTVEGRVCNGRHRLAAAIVLGQAVATREGVETSCDCDWEYFTKLELAPVFADSMAIEFCRLKPESRLAVVFGDHDRSELMNALGIDVFYAKETEVSGPGPFNLVNELYFGEDWLSVNGRTKAAMCYPGGAGPLTIYVLDVRVSDFDVRVAKQEARRVIGWNNIHINDTHEETMRIASALLNENGMHFINHAYPRTYAHAHAHVRAHAHGVSIDSGGVLEAYGLRRASDIDFVDEDLHLEFHGVPLQDLLDDPRNFFWSAGVKYASIPAVRRMKENRGEEKDKRDLALMEGL